MSKGLKRILSGKSGLKAETDKIEDLIYRSVKSKKKFDIERLVEASKLLTKNLVAVRDGTLKDFDPVNNAFINFISEFTAETFRDKRKFHPSSLRHDCERMLYYQMADYEESDRVADDIDGRLQMIFDQGHWFHSYIQAALFRAGILLQAEVPVVDKKRKIGGRMDGKILLNGIVTALEIKTMNSFRFRVGKVKPFEDNVFQNSFYANHLGIKQILFLYFNKDTSEIAVHLLKTNETYAELANEKIDFVLESVEDGIAPKRRVCKTMESKNAVNCPFRTLCFNVSKKTKSLPVKKKRIIRRKL